MTRKRRLTFSAFPDEFISFLEAARRSDRRLIGRRYLACWIDYLLLGGIYIAANVYGERTRFGSEINLASFIALLAYFPLLEGYFGVTPGKWLLGVRVVDAIGRPPGLTRATERTALRAIELNPIIGCLPAGIVALFSKYKQRMGDMYAGTVVLYASDVAELHRRLDTPADMRPENGDSAGE